MNLPLHCCSFTSKNSQTYHFLQNLIFLFVLVLSTVSVQAQIWTGAVSSNWNNAANWQGNVPSTLDFVTINASANDPEISGSVTLLGIQVNNGATLKIRSSGTLNLNNLNTGTLAILDVYEGTVVNNGTINITSAGSEENGILVEAGTLTNESTTPGGNVSTAIINIDGIGGDGIQVLGTGMFTNQDGIINIGQNDAIADNGILVNGGSFTNVKTFITTPLTINIDNIGNDGIKIASGASFSFTSAPLNIGVNSTIGNHGINNNGALINSGTLTVARTDGNGINNRGTFTNNGTCEVKRGAIYGLYNSNTAVFENRSGSSIRIGTVEATESDGLFNEGLINNRGTIYIKETGDDGLTNSGTNSTFLNSSDGIVNIGTQGGSIGGIGLLNRQSGTFTNDASTINIENTGTVDSEQGWGAITQEGASFNNINGALLTIGQNGGSVLMFGFVVAANGSSSNSGSTIKIDNIEGRAFVVEVGDFENNNNGVIDIGQGGNNITINGISLRGGAVFKNNNSTVNIDRTGNDAMINSVDAEFLNSNNGQLNIGQTGGVNTIGASGIRNIEDSNFRNNGGIININNTATHGIRHESSITFENNNGQINIGQTGGANNIGSSGIQAGGNFNNNGGSISIDQVTESGLFIRSNSNFENNNNGLISIGQTGGTNTIGRHGIGTTQNGIFKNNSSRVYIDNVTTNGIDHAGNGTFENSGGAFIYIGQNGGANTIGQQGIEMTGNGIFKNNGSTMYIDNVTKNGIDHVGNGTFENSGGAFIYIGQNGEAGNIGSMGIAADATFENNASTIYVDNYVSAGISISYLNTNFENNTNAEIYIGSNGVPGNSGLDVEYGLFKNDGTLHVYKSLIIRESGTLSGDGVYNIYRDWEFRSGTFNAGSSTVNIVGALNSNIRGSMETAFNELIIEKDDNSARVRVATSFSTVQDLFVNNGYLITNSAATITTPRFETLPAAKLTHNGRINATNWIDLEGTVDGDGIYDSAFGFVTGANIDFDEEANSTVILSGSGNGAFGSIANTTLNNFLIDKDSPSANVTAGANLRCRNFRLNSGELAQDETISAENITIEANGTWQANGGLISISGKLENNGQLNGNFNSLLNLFLDIDTEVTGNAFSIGQLWVNKTSASAEVNLATDVNILNKLDFRSGQGVLNLASGVVVTLASGAFIEEESETSYIKGLGHIQTTVTLNVPIFQNPGNLGVEITSNANLGSTTIKRYHQSQNIIGQRSILRYYDISPTNNSGLDATVVFEYHDHELNGWSESDLAAYRFNGSQWEVYNATQINTVQNFVEVQGIDAFSTWTLAASGISGALPVELVYFSAKKEGSDVLLEWQTSSEVNNEGFEIEHSTNGRDWHSIDFIAGQGNSTEDHYYTFLHKEAAPGTNYYRLRQIDFDGQWEYSEIRSVEFKIASGEIKIFPNPASSFSTIQLMEAYEVAHIQVSDMSGRVLLDQRGFDQARLSLETGAWKSGVYIVQLQVDGRLYTQKLVVAHE